MLFVFVIMFLSFMNSSIPEIVVVSSDQNDTLLPETIHHGHQSQLFSPMSTTHQKNRQRRCLVATLLPYKSRRLRTLRPMSFAPIVTCLACSWLEVSNIMFIF
jgi:hypothetical protein